MYYIISSILQYIIPELGREAEDTELALVDVCLGVVGSLPCPPPLVVDLPLIDVELDTFVIPPLPPLGVSDEPCAPGGKRLVCGVGGSSNGSYIPYILTFNICICVRVCISIYA